MIAKAAAPDGAAVASPRPCDGVAIDPRVDAIEAARPPGAGQWRAVQRLFSALMEWNCEGQKEIGMLRKLSLVTALTAALALPTATLAWDGHGGGGWGGGHGGWGGGHGGLGGGHGGWGGGWHHGGGWGRGGGWGGGWGRRGWGGYGGGCWRWWYGQWVWTC